MTKQAMIRWAGMAMLAAVTAGVVWTTPTKVVAAAGGKSAEAVVGLPSFSEPSISPDGSEIAFVSGGDIWTVPADGGVARLLVAHSGNDTRPMYSPDGKRLAFVSNRTGNGDIYVLQLETGDLRRVTFGDMPEQLDSWSPDGKWIYFSCSDRDLGAMNQDVYRIPADGGAAMTVIGETYENEFGAAVAKDGKTTVFCSGGAAARDWWRKGHSHWDETQLYVMREGSAKPTFDALTPPGVKDQWPIWSADFKSVYYVSDRDGAQNLWQVDVPATPSPGDKPAGGKKISQFTGGRVLYPSMTADGSTFVFERDFGVWKLDAKTGQAKELKITLRGASQTGGKQNITFTGGFRDLVVSPDGRKLAFVVHGEVFAASSTGGLATRVTRTPGAEGHLDWSPDSRRLAYVSDRHGSQNIYLYDFGSGQELPFTYSDADDASPRFSPDGKSIAFIRGGNELIVKDLQTRQERLIARGLNGALPPFDDAQSPFDWSPKGNWIAYIASGAKGFDNVFVAPTAGEASGVIASADGGAVTPRQVTFFANTGSNSVAWSPNGNFITFGTGQRTEDYQLARVDLVPRPPSFIEDQFRGLFQEPERTSRPPTPTTPRPGTGPNPLGAPEGPATRPAEAPGGGMFNRLKSLPKPGEDERYSFDGIRQRVSLLPIGVDVEYQTVAPSGQVVLVVGSAAGKVNLYLYPAEHAGPDPAVFRQITATAGGKSSVQWAFGGREVVFLENGVIKAVTTDGQVRDIPVSAPMELDFAAERLEVGRQAWKFLKLNFFDENFNGANWDAVRETYFPRFAGARTSDELRRLINLMVGELNASHLGCRGPERFNISGGRIGIRFDRAAYDKARKFRVAEVLPNSPAAVAGIAAGDWIVAIDNEPLDADANIDALLDHKIGRRVVLSRSRKADGSDAGDVPILPVDLATEKTLTYKAWVEQNRQHVEKLSKGRLSYVHIADMGKSALARLTAELDSRAFLSDGVIVDIRGNTGGFSSPYVLDVFARRGYLNMTRRGTEPTPGRPYVGQRALELPTVLMTNRQSVSDAENFTEGYRALGLGKVVGEPTAGGVIFTSEASLLDGSSFRIPFSKVQARDGSGLEARPRPVDVHTPHVVGESLGGANAQLDSAVRTLLKRIDG